MQYMMHRNEKQAERLNSFTARTELCDNTSTAWDEADSVVTVSGRDSNGIMDDQVDFSPSERRKTVLFQMDALQKNGSKNQDVDAFELADMIEKAEGSGSILSDPERSSVKSLTSSEFLAVTRLARAYAPPRNQTADSSLPPPPRAAEGMRKSESWHHRNRRLTTHVKLVERISRVAKDEEGENSQKDPWLPLLIVIFCLYGGCFVIPSAVLSQKDADFVLHYQWDNYVLFETISYSCAVLPITAFLLWALKQVTPTASHNNEREKYLSGRERLVSFIKSLVPNRIIFLLAVIICINQLQKVAKVVVQKEYTDTALHLINVSQAFAIYAFLIAFLEFLVNKVHHFADNLEGIAEGCRKSKKWKKIMLDTSTFYDNKLDKSYSLPGGNRSPARVLAEVVGVYSTIGKGAGFVLLFLYIIGIDLYTNTVIIGLTAFLAALINALHINNALGNLLPLSLSNSLHVGEIVSIYQTGGPPGDDPDSALTGFVEGITWSHVVIRDFRKKQVSTSLHNNSISR